VATDGSGQVYVADMGNNRIQKFNASGTFLNSWASQSPATLATDGRGHVYVADTGNNRIQKFACP
jgi:DNA-binding beta-propeller fold protein YncE